jgi:hypothetical protein
VRRWAHCPTYDYPVIPSAMADEVNAVAKLEHYYGKVDHRLHLIDRLLRVHTSSRRQLNRVQRPPRSTPLPS